MGFTTAPRIRPTANSPCAVGAASPPRQGERLRRRGALPASRRARTSRIHQVLSLAGRPPAPPKPARRHPRSRWSGGGGSPLAQRERGTHVSRHILAAPAGHLAPEVVRLAPPDIRGAPCVMTEIGAEVLTSAQASPSPSPVLEYSSKNVLIAPRGGRPPRVMRESRRPGRRLAPRRCHGPVLPPGPPPGKVPAGRMGAAKSSPTAPRSSPTPPGPGTTPMGSPIEPTSSLRVSLTPCHSLSRQAPNTLALKCNGNVLTPTARVDRLGARSRPSANASTTATSLLRGASRLALREPPGAGSVNYRPCRPVRSQRSRRLLRGSDESRPLTRGRDSSSPPTTSRSACRWRWCGRSWSR